MVVKKSGPQTLAGVRAGKSKSTREIIFNPFPRCQLRGHSIFDELPLPPCPLRESNPQDGLLAIKDGAFRKLDAASDSSIQDGLLDQQTYDTCDRCMELIRSDAHHRALVHWLRESATNRNLSATSRQPEAAAIALPVYVEKKAIASTNGKPVVEIAPKLIHRRRKPGNVR